MTSRPPELQRAAAAPMSSSPRRGRAPAYEPGLQRFGIGTKLDARHITQNADFDGKYEPTGSLIRRGFPQGPQHAQP